MAIHEWKNQPEDFAEQKKCIGKLMKEFAIICGHIVFIGIVGMLSVIIMTGYPATGLAALSIYAIGIGEAIFILFALRSTIKKINECKAGEI
jgi:hypothetical protein